MPYLLGLVWLGMAALGWMLGRGMTPRPLSAPSEPVAQALDRLLMERGWPSPARSAVEQVAGSVVRVQSLAPNAKNKNDTEEIGVGTGVVVSEEGLILTNLHVVWGAQGLKITFADGPGRRRGGGGLSIWHGAFGLLGRDLGAEPRIQI